MKCIVLLETKNVYYLLCFLLSGRRHERLAVPLCLYFGTEILTSLTLCQFLVIPVFISHLLGYKCIIDSLMFVPILLL